MSRSRGRSATTANRASRMRRGRALGKYWVRNNQATSQSARRLARRREIRGGATDQEVLECLMGDERARVLWTDPTASTTSGRRLRGLSARSSSTGDTASHRSSERTGSASASTSQARFLVLLRRRFTTLIAVISCSKASGLRSASVLAASSTRSSRALLARIPKRNSTFTP